MSDFTLAEVKTAQCPLCGAVGGLGWAGMCDHSPSSLGAVWMASEAVHWDRIAVAVATGTVSIQMLRANFQDDDDKQRVDILAEAAEQAINRLGE